MTKSGFDLGEIERRGRAFLFQECQPDRGDVFSWMDDHMADFIHYALHNSAPAILTEIRELRAENARLKEALSHAQGRFLNINIALSSGGTKREAIRIADVGEDCAKNALARAALGEP